MSVQALMISIIKHLRSDDTYIMSQGDIISSSGIKISDLQRIHESNITSDDVSIDYSKIGDDFFRWTEMFRSNPLYDKVACYLLRIKSMNHDQNCHHSNKVVEQKRSQMDIDSDLQLDNETQRILLNGVLDQISNLSVKINEMTNRIDHMSNQLLSINEILLSNTIDKMKSNHWFISHAGVDKWIAVFIAKMLKLFGEQVWLDKIDIKDNNEQSIYPAISTCKTFIIIESDLYYNKPWCQREFGVAIHSKRDIVCFRQTMSYKQYPGNSIDGDDINKIKQFINVISSRLNRQPNINEMEVIALYQYCSHQTWDFDSIMKFIK